MNTRQIKRSSWVSSVLLFMAAFAARAAEPWEVLPATPTLPAHTVGHHATVSGATIWYAQWGAGRPGTPVLLLHGGYGNSNYSGNLIPVLVAHGYHVIAMDSRGHGRSARTNEPITYHLMASDRATLPAYTAAQLASISVPTTIADGQYDEGIKPEHTEYLAATIPGARLVILPNLSHFAMLQGPRAFNAAVLDFLHDYNPAP